MCAVKQDAVKGIWWTATHTHTHTHTLHLVGGWLIPVRYSWLQWKARWDGWENYFCYQEWKQVT